MKKRPAAIQARSKDGMDSGHLLCLCDRFPHRSSGTHRNATIHGHMPHRDARAGLGRSFGVLVSHSSESCRARSQPLRQASQRRSAHGSSVVSQPCWPCADRYLCALLQRLPTSRDQVCDPPARKNPPIEIAFVPDARRKRLAPLILTNQLLEPVMSDQFGNSLRPAF